MSRVITDLVDEYLTSAEAAFSLRITEGTLRKWRMVGKGPKWSMNGGRVYYRRDRIRAWIHCDEELEGTQGNRSL